VNVGSKVKAMMIITIIRNITIRAELFCGATGVWQTPQIFCLGSTFDAQLPHSNFVEHTAHSSRIPAIIRNGQTKIPMTPMHIATKNNPPPLCCLLGVALGFVSCLIGFSLIATGAPHFGQLTARLDTSLLQSGHLINADWLVDVSGGGFIFSD
jgi:hypothetical protein